MDPPPSHAFWPSATSRPTPIKTEPSITNPDYLPWLVSRQPVNTPPKQQQQQQQQYQRHQTHEQQNQTRQHHPPHNVMRRSDSHETESSVEMDAAELAEESAAGADPRARSRRKNRAAAARSRAKKRAYISETESQMRKLQTQNTALKGALMELRNMVSELRHYALQHTPAARDCRCVAIHQYNLLKVQEVVSSMAGGRKR